MTVRKRGKIWWYDFGNHKYRGPIPEARTKYEAQEAEIKLKRDVFEGKFGKQFGTMAFSDFVGDPDTDNDQFGEGTFLEWSKNNKRSWKHDRFRVRVLLDAFRGKSLGEISPLVIERFKSQRQHYFTKYDKQRSPASVNRELELLSRIFSLAVRLGLAEFNPCSRVSKFKLQNQRHRYLLPDEEPVFDKTKSGRPRVVEINSDFSNSARDKRPDDFVWINPVTGEPYTDIKRSFSGACTDAKIEGLVWHDLRATYGTRLGEAGFNAYDIAKLMGHANISTSQRYVRNLPVGAGEAVMLKNQRRHNTVTSEAPAALALVANS